jgi:hypothetical protein|nr:hypothetical protein [Candidatus Krumholzibacteria bacterium]
MKNRCYLPILVGLILCVPAAHAWDGVQVLEATGFIREHIYGAPSPVPGWCYWEQDEPVTSFHATNEDGHGNMECPHYFLAHCDDDSMIFYGSWPLNDHIYTIGASYEAQLVCTVLLTSNSWLMAQRENEWGTLTSDLKTVTLQHPSGASEEILAEVGPDTLQVMLTPGTYTVSIQVNLSQSAPYPNPVLPFSGWVGVTWEDPAPVATEPVTMGAVKALFR